MKGNSGKQVIKGGQCDILCNEACERKELHRIKGMKVLEKVKIKKNKGGKTVLGATVDRHQFVSRLTSGEKE